MEKNPEYYGPLLAMENEEGEEQGDADEGGEGETDDAAEPPAAAAAAAAQ